MSELMDFGAILRSGAAAVPDYAAQEANRQMMRIQQMQAESQRASVGLQAQKAQRDADQQARFQARMQEIAALPSKDRPQAIAALAGEFPDMSEGLKRSYDMMDEGRKASDLKQLGEIHGALTNGRADVAVRVLERRIAADTAAGEVDPEDAAMLDDLKSGDPARVAAAQSRVGFAISAIDPAKFSETYKTLNPKADPTTLQKEVEYYRSIGRDDLAQQLLENKADPLTQITTAAGISIMPRSMIMGGGGFGGGDVSRPPYGAPGFGDGLSKGGDPASGGAGGRVSPVSDGVGIARKLFPEAEITSGYRGPNHPLSKANPASYHAKTHGAIDVKPVPGITFAQYVKRYKDAGYRIIEAKNEVGKGRSKHATGDHWHIVLGEPRQQADASPVRVKTVQQARALPKGTRFITPDGRMMIR